MRSAEPSTSLSSLKWSLFDIAHLSYDAISYLIYSAWSWLPVLLAYFIDLKEVPPPDQFLEEGWIWVGLSSLEECLLQEEGQGINGSFLYVVGGWH